MIALILKVTLVLTMAALLDLGLLRRRGSAAARHLLWTLAVAALLVLPLATTALPAWRVIDMPTPELAAPVVELNDGGARPMQTAQPTQTSSAQLPTASAGSAAVEPAATPIDFGAIAFALYAAVALSLLLKVIAEHLMVARLTRVCRVVEDAEWRDLVDEVRASLGVRREVVLLEGPASVMPLTWGVRRPCVLVPESAQSWPQERRRAVLLHEIAHIARHDCATQTLASVARAVYWPHPGAWLAAQRLRVEREMACDEMAVMRGIPRLSYAEHLLEIARSYRAPRLTAGAVAMARSRIEGRLRSLIDGRRLADAPSRRAKLATIAAACAMLLPLAALAPSAATPDVADVTGRWDMRLAAADEGEGNGPLVHLMLRAPGMNTQYVPIAAFEGLTLAHVRRDGPATFTLRRGPGSFRFQGDFEGGRGSGSFVFTPDSRFADALVARGMTRPTEAELFTLARHAMEIDFLDELASQGYPQPTTALFVRTSLTGVDVRVLRELRAGRTRFADLEMLIDAWNNGRIASSAAPPPPPPPIPGDEPSPAAPPAPPTPGVYGTPADIAPPAAPPQPGYPSPSRAPEAPVGSADVAAPPAPPAPAPSLPGSPADVPPPPSPPAPPAPRETPTTGAWNLIPTRGGGHVLELLWDDDTQWRRGFSLGELTYAPPSGRGVWVILRDAGRLEMNGSGTADRASGELRFVPNRAFGQTLRRLGIAPRERAVSDHDLKNLTWGNVGEREVVAFNDQFDRLTYDDVITFAIRGVTPEYVTAIREAGVVAPSARDIIELRFADVTVSDVRALREAGQRDMSASAIIDAARRRG